MGFTGHHDPHVHMAMLERYDDFDHHPDAAAPGRSLVPKLRELGFARGTKAGPRDPRDEEPRQRENLLQSLSVRQCIQYVLSLPIHCLAVAARRSAQIEDDARIAQEFRQYSQEEMTAIRDSAKRLAGAHLEDWKRDLQQASNRPEYTGA